MKFISQPKDQLAAWAAERIPGCERGFGACSTLGVLNERDDLLAVIVFHNWSPEAEAIEVSGASVTPHWFNRATIRRVGSYVFDHLQCQAAVFRTGGEDRRTRRLLTRGLGTSEHIIPRLRGRAASEAIHVLTVEDWRTCKFSEALNVSSETRHSRAA